MMSGMNAFLKRGGDTRSLFPFHVQTSKQNHVRIQMEDEDHCLYQEEDPPQGLTVLMSDVHLPELRERNSLSNSSRL